MDLLLSAQPWRDSFGMHTLALSVGIVLCINFSIKVDTLIIVIENNFEHVLHQTLFEFFVFPPSLSKDKGLFINLCERHNLNDSSVRDGYEWLAVAMRAVVVLEVPKGMGRNLEPS